MKKRNRSINLSRTGDAKKDYITAQQLRSKKINIYETAVRRKEFQVAEITWHNGSYCFQTDLGDPTWKCGRIFCLKQADALKTIQAPMQKMETGKGRNHNLLSDVAANFDEYVL